MNTDIQKKQDASLPAQFNPASMAGMGLSAADMLMPRVLLMQGSSELVKKAKTKSAGDVIDSVSGETLLSAKDAADGKKIEMIPLTAYKTWIIDRFDTVKQKWVYHTQKPMLPNEEGLPWEFQEQDPQSKLIVQYRRKYRINVYALIKSQIGTDDSLPYLVSFQVFSLAEGKKITTHMLKAARNKKYPYCKSFYLSSGTTTSKRGDSFEIFKVELGAEVPKNQQAAAHSWMEEIQTGRVKVDSDEEEKKASAGGSNSPQGAPTEDDVPF
jgi:hypothetical protein